MARAIWKGAISFGLVHIPVALVSATSSQGVDFDWLDKRSMEPVGYKRVNKATGKEVDSKDIVKGVEYEKGRYVVLSEEEIRSAHPKSTQTIEIFAFLDSSQIPLPNIETPYYLAPDRSGGKGMHLIVPLARHADWDTVKAFAKAIAQFMTQQLPERLQKLKSDPWHGYTNRQRITRRMWEKLGIDIPHKYQGQLRSFSPFP